MNRSCERSRARSCSAYRNTRRHRWTGHCAPRHLIVRAIGDGRSNLECLRWGSDASHLASSALRCLFFCRHMVLRWRSLIGSERASSDATVLPILTGNPRQKSADRSPMFCSQTAYMIGWNRNEQVRMGSEKPSPRRRCQKVLARGKQYVGTATCVKEDLWREAVVRPDRRESKWSF